MRGDETQRGVAPGAESRERRGRHAAPRKSLLNKLQIPVGKTMALAAMPTAVLVGMGMAPKLALADDKEIPFAPGPCVTRSDEPSPSASPSPSGSPSASPSPGTSPGASPAPDASKAPKPGASPAATPSAKQPEAPKERKQETPAAKPSASASPSPSAAKTTNPLDPLGVGDALKGLVDALGRPLQGAQKPAPAPSTPSTPKAPAADPQADAIRDAAHQAGATVEELPQSVKDTVKTPKDETGKTADDAGKADTDKADGASPSPSTTADPNGKQPFPCPTFDAKALADAKLEQGIPLLPDEPWYLDSSLLTLYGLDYEGIVEVKTAGGHTKKVLKFTADSLDIKDLYQTVGKTGNVAHLKSRPGSTSKIRDGKVTMYTESLKGNLFGLIPIEFTPNSPPPLNVPFAFFTNVKVVQAGQFGGNLTVPGLHNYIGPPEG
ncbi:hypothetical protein BX286_5018 [Streptomyces sp. 3211.6]|uniref:hypothetical protein n=1 Tax=Streptomyces TaxID=1883 RepID=UPI0009A502D0|nr:MULTISPECIES: hypothetical protein [Streptomyces]RKT06970.1 hypothetical protein BX286_5018 [Streptomyces sp. 3211.6]RPF45421.1 hypothetical protein EDD96_1980 [Streptomyces sp. Ag109_G2-6]